ncbi:hypothetical protein ACWV27_10080 [Massilia varians]
MKKTAAIVLGACSVISLSFAAGPPGTWQPLQGATYKIFSGDSVAYAEAPTVKDRKISVLVRGQAAKELFDSIGPDETEACSTTKGDRERNKKAIQCMYTAKDANDPTKGYRCWIGVDLVTGQGIPTVSC